jgi:hypothetical protein
VAGTCFEPEPASRPKANTDLALWGLMRPEGPCCFQEPSAPPPPSAPERVATRQTVREAGSAIRTVQVVAFAVRRIAFLGSLLTSLLGYQMMRQAGLDNKPASTAALSPTPPKPRR